jgi:adenine deaminase
LELTRLITLARGDEPADLVLRSARLVNVFTGEIYPTDVAIAGGTIVGLGDSQGYAGRTEIDLAGRYLCPGFIDAHVHVESAMVPPREFARAVLPHGVTTVVTDPHEIANVLGLDGIRFMLENARGSRLSMFVNAPSCVPATPLATSRAALEAGDLTALLNEPAVLGLAEVMNFPGVVNADPGILAKLRAFDGRVIDGHCPLLAGRALNAYVIAGIGSDHECSELEEAREKLRLGMTLFLREASHARNLRSLLPLVTPANERRLCLCTDDRQPPDLLAEGSIDHLIRIAISEGVDPVTAIRMATLNPAEYFRLHDRGAVAPGRRADLVIFERLDDLRPERVYVAGELAAREGELLPESNRDGQDKQDEEVGRFQFQSCLSCPSLFNSVRVDWSRVGLAIPASGRRLRVIGARPNQLLTDALVMDACLAAGRAVADPARDLLKMAVIERHGRSGTVGLGFVHGIGLAHGAIAGTVAHDHHNLVVIGADDVSMLTAARAVAAAGGGQAAAQGETALALLPLPIAGLMSDQPIEQVRDSLDALIAAAHRLGSPLRDPFMAMSFLALEVIPELKLTDQGLVDVNHSTVVPLFVADEGVS